MSLKQAFNELLAWIPSPAKSNKTGCYLPSPQLACSGIQLNTHSVICFFSLCRLECECPGGVTGSAADDGQHDRQRGRTEDRATGDRRTHAVPGDNRRTQAGMMLDGCPTLPQGF